MKRIIAAVLAMIMMLALVACGGGSEADSLVGTWKADMDMSSMTNEMLASLGEGMEEYFEFEGFSVTMVLTFKDDGTYTSEIDKASAEAAVDSMLVTIEDGMVKMLEAQIAEYGLDMTVEELLETSGMTMEDMMAELDAEELVDEMVGTTTEGNYQAKDGKLYLSDGTNYEVDEEMYDTYELDGDTLTLTEHFGSEDEEEMAFAEEMYPITFKKAN